MVAPRGGGEAHWVKFGRNVAGSKEEAMGRKSHTVEFKGTERKHTHTGFLTYITSKRAQRI